MLGKTLLKHFKGILLLVLITLLAICPVYAKQGRESLYSYVMSTYNKSYVDKSSAEEKLLELQSQYEVVLHNNLQAESFESAKEYAKELEYEINKKIDDNVYSLQKKQNSVVEEIEDGIMSMTPMQLSILNREYTKFNEEINTSLQHKTSIVSLYDRPVYERVDTSELETSIKEQEEIVGYNAGDTDTYLGDLDAFKRPFSSRPIVTSKAGYRIDPINGKVSFHNATDYAMPVGTELYSLFNGTVVRSENVGDAYGENIKIDCGNGIILHYAHLSERLVKVGDVVTQNQLIGKSGNTGRSTGPHLHLGLFYKGEVLDIEELFK